MRAVTWSEDLSVGVPEIDADHRRLVQMLDELATALEEARSREVLGPILQRLVVYTQEHFSREEAAMARTRYPDAAPHAREHADLAAKVWDLHGRVAGGATSLLSREVVTFLSLWLLHHIQGSDRALGRHLQAHDLEAGLGPARRRSVSA